MFRLRHPEVPRAHASRAGRFEGSPKLLGLPAAGHLSMTGAGPRRMPRLMIAVVALLLGAPAFAADPLLNPVFQDHAVLQREMPIHIWGAAAPGSTITVTLAGKSAQGRATETGKWEAILPAMAAGGPYVLTATDDKGGIETVADLLVGDVYLCSGQSNMALSVKETIDAGAEIQGAANDSIRLMTVANRTSTTPLTNLPAPVKWAAVSPTTVPDFSGACYYFGRELQKSVHVPLGLIESAWGGANITTFMSTAALRQTGGDNDRLLALNAYAKDPVAGMAQWGTLIEAWWRQHLGSTPWTTTTNDWPVAPAGLGYWTDWNIPALSHFVGNVWFRTEVTLTAEQAAQQATLSLGTINEEDQTWVNGRFIGSTFAYAAPRNYELPAGALHAGANDILVNVYCSWRGCGMFGSPDARFVRFKDGSTTPLSGPWRYQQVPASVGLPPRLPWGATAGLSVAYNAMIAPLAPFSLRGVLWYQGESNTSDPIFYRPLLKAMMADWRTTFGQQLPFLVVQLPDFGLPPITPEASGWAQLRESERLAVAEDPKAALAVTVDIGSHFGLHPGNKQEVGRRLSIAARNLIYGDHSVSTGPSPVTASRIKGAVRVQFAGINQKLVAYNADQPIGFELCGASEESCRFAVATIAGNAVDLKVPAKSNPTHVRYCWADGPVCTLYDAARMPAVPFDIPIQMAPAKRRRH